MCQHSNPNDSALNPTLPICAPRRRLVIPKQRLALRLHRFYIPLGLFLRLTIAACKGVVDQRLNDAEGLGVITPSIFRRCAGIDVKPAVVLLLTLEAATVLGKLDAAHVG